ncbi:hypothetical protein ACWD6I_30220, partial [Streptomyces sp. NPDC002454]
MNRMHALGAPDGHRPWTPDVQGAGSGGNADAAARWLLLAAESPEVAVQEWRARGVALLACGGVFDAVRAPCDLVRVAVSAADDIRAVGVLRAALGGGPIFVDRATRQVYALTASGAWSPERIPLVERLGRGCYLGVPQHHRFADHALAGEGVHAPMGQ